VRVLVLGGGGAMGAVAARFISQLTEVTGLTVADRQTQSAADAVASLSLLPGVSVLPKALQLDVDDTSELAKTISAHDIVVNAVGPFYRFGVPILRAVISQGRHYVDICDDWEPTIEMLALDEQAQATGSICVVGAGASPGASNMLAVLAARELDEVHDVFTVWPVDVGGDDDEDAIESVTSTGDIPSAAVVHWMQQISGTIRVVDGGKFVDVPPLQPIAMTFPGHGSGTAYSVGHPEPITLKSSLGVTGRSANAMLITPSTLAFLDGLRHDIDAGKLTNETAASQVEDPSVRRQAKAAISGLTKHGPGKLPLFFALATGLKNGVLMRSGATVNALPSGMANATSAPAAITVGQLISGKISRAGVHPPERVVDADAFFAALHPYCEQLGSDEPVAVVTTEVISP
jgi:lysine 6-dehydrogenase